MSTREPAPKQKPCSTKLREMSRKSDKLARKTPSSSVNIEIMRSDGLNRRKPRSLLVATLMILELAANGGTRSLTRIDQTTAGSLCLSITALALSKQQTISMMRQMSPIIPAIKLIVMKDNQLRR